MAGEEVPRGDFELARGLLQTLAAAQAPEARQAPQVPGVLGEIEAAKNNPYRSFETSPGVLENIASSLFPHAYGPVLADYAQQKVDAAQAKENAAAQQQFNAQQVQAANALLNLGGSEADLIKMIDQRAENAAQAERAKAQLGIQRAQLKIQQEQLGIRRDENEFRREELGFRRDEARTKAEREAAEARQAALAADRTERERVGIKERIRRGEVAPGTKFKLTEKGYEMTVEAPKAGEDPAAIAAAQEAQREAAKAAGLVEESRTIDKDGKVSIKYGDPKKKDTAAVLEDFAKAYLKAQGVPDTSGADAYLDELHDTEIKARKAGTGFRWDDKNNNGQVDVESGELVGVNVMSNTEKQKVLARGRGALQLTEMLDDQRRYEIEAIAEGQYGLNGAVNNGLIELRSQIRALRSSVRERHGKSYENFIDPDAPVKQSVLDKIEDALNPNIGGAAAASAVEQINTLLPYFAAMTLANQTGRGLSDNDVQFFQRAIGTPTDDSPITFFTKLDLMQSAVISILETDIINPIRDDYVGTKPISFQMTDSFEFDPFNGMIGDRKQQKAYMDAKRRVGNMRYMNDTNAPKDDKIALYHEFRDIFSDEQATRMASFGPLGDPVAMAKRRDFAARALWDNGVLPTTREKAEAMFGPKAISLESILDRIEKYGGGAGGAFTGESIPMQNAPMHQDAAAIQQRRLAEAQAAAAAGGN